MLYYSEKPNARPHNMKTRELADYLNRFKKTVFELGNGFTAFDILQHFETVTAGLNQNHRGAEIKVRKNEIGGKIHYIFTEPNGDCVGEVTLSNTLKHIDCEESL